MGPALEKLHEVSGLKRPGPLASEGFSLWRSPLSHPTRVQRRVLFTRLTSHGRSSRPLWPRSAAQLSRHRAPSWCGPTAHTLRAQRQLSSAKRREESLDDRAWPQSKRTRKAHSLQKPSHSSGKTCKHALIKGSHYTLDRPSFRSHSLPFISSRPMHLTVSGFRRLQSSETRSPTTDYKQHPACHQMPL